MLMEPVASLGTPSVEQQGETVSPVSFFVAASGAIMFTWLWLPSVSFLEVIGVSGGRGRWKSSALPVFSRSQSKVSVEYLWHPLQRSYLGLNCTVANGSSVTDSFYSV